MRRVTIAVLAFFILAVPAALDAQQRGPQQRANQQRANQQPQVQRPAARMVHGPMMATHILAHAAQLGLSGEQVTSITAIRTQLERQNRPLQDQLRTAMQAHREQLREARARTTGASGNMRERRAAMPVPEAVRGLAEQVRENTRDAMEEIRNTLTAEQRATVRSLRPAAPRDMGGRGPVRGR